MADFKKQRGLGRGFNPRGLSALIDTDISDNQEVGSGVELVDITKISPNRSQPRKSFIKESLDELCDSIREVGIIQPLIVKKNGSFYEIVAGERRYRAARLAGLDKIPVIVRDYNELETLQTALIENIQREDLSPVEEALTYKRFNEEFSLTQEEIAKKVGKNRSTVANSMRLLKLDKRVLEMINDKRLTAGHGKALASLDSKEKQYDLAAKILDSGLSVRQAEDLVVRTIKKKNKPEEQPVTNPYVFVQKELTQLLGTKVSIKKQGKKGKLEIEFYSDDWIDSFLTLIKSTVS